MQVCHLGWWSAARRRLVFQRAAALANLREISSVSQASDRPNPLQVKNEDSVALRICDAQAPPIGKDPAHGKRRRDYQFGQVLARERHVDGETANRLASNRLGEPQQEPGEPLFHPGGSKILEPAALLLDELLEHPDGVQGDRRMCRDGLKNRRGIPVQRLRIICWSTAWSNRSR